MAGLGIMALLALVVLVGGWLAGISTFIQLRQGLAGMVPSTAFSFLMAGTLLVFISRQSLSGKGARRWLNIISVLIGAIAIADLIVIFAGLATGIDALIWPDVRSFQTYSMAPATAMCFVLTAIALYRLSRDRPSEDMVFVCTATLGLALSMIALVGYMFDASALYEVSIFTAMAAHTAIAFVLLFSALLMLRPQDGWVGLLLADKAGSSSARRLFPIVILVPLILCFVALTVTRAGFFNSDFRLAVLAIVIMVMLAASVLRNAMIRNRAEDKLSVTNAELTQALADKDLLLREVYHRVKNNLQQINALIMIEASKAEDDSAKKALRSMTNRIHALGLVHRMLIASPQPSNINAQDFFRDLCRNIAHGHGQDRAGVTIRSEATAEKMPIDPAITLGLLINELTSNAYKHAFSADEEGQIIVRFIDPNDGHTKPTLTVSDSGKGIDLDADGNLTGSGAGKRIIHGLVSQLRAEVKIQTGSTGTIFTIYLPPDFKTSDLYA